MTEVKEMSSAQLIASCIWMDREQKKIRTLMNKYKAELQARGLAQMEDHNVKYVKFYAPEGSVAITDSMSLDILNPDKLKQVVGASVFAGKLKVSTEIKYKCDPKFERALKAIFTGDYTFEMTLEEFLTANIDLDSGQRQFLLKKLKGDFEKDKETLLSVLDPEGTEAPDLDVELWYIYRIKNAELIRAFLPEPESEGGLEDIIRDVRKSIMVETKTAITLDYEDETEG